MLFASVLALAYWRQFGCALTGVALDSVFALFIVLFVKGGTPCLAASANRFLEFCGKHSFNIFLFHTFIFYLYFPEVIYWPRHPVLIFIWLLAICLVVSVGIERLKKILHIA